MDQRRFIPRMFHRRLTLVMALMAGATMVLSLRLVSLAAIHGEAKRAEAERRLDRRRFLPTTRGRILDRKGRYLAVDVASYDIAVDYRVINESWPVSRAVSAARKTHGEAWGEMTPDERAAAIQTELPVFDAIVDQLWRDIREAGGLSEADLQERLEAIKGQVESTAAAVWQAQYIRERAKYADDETVSVKRRPIREQVESHVILPRVPNDVAFRFQRMEDELDGLIEVIDSTRRDYPWTTRVIELDRTALPSFLQEDGETGSIIEIDGVADHILGSMRGRVWASDFERRPFFDSSTGEYDLGGYRVGDSVGVRGIEAALEDHLRGLRGMVLTRLDTGDTVRTERTPGRDVTIALDIELQAQVQAILSPAFGLTRVHQYQAGWDSATGSPRELKLPENWPLNSAAVVLDVQSGDILAMVSKPTMHDGFAMSDLERNATSPLVNRAVEAIYPPGSIIKPLVLASAVSEGVHSLDDRIACTGHFYPHNTSVARCWIYRPPGFFTHAIESQVGGALDAVQALARSCNIYFYTLGNRMGLARLSTWFRRFGLGAPFDIGLRQPFTDPASGEVRYAGESGGTTPSEKDIASLREQGSLDFASTIMGIGQGPVTWTPLHAAHSYAMLGRRGRWLTPRLVLDGGDAFERGDESDRDLPLPECLTSTILEGLRQSVMADYGTGHHIRRQDRSTEPILNAANATVWAKTGTAQAPPYRADFDGDGVLDKRDDLEHAWFVGLVGSGAPGVATPEYAIAVIVEYGGSGGRTAGPIANQIILALQREGYLAPPAGPSSGASGGGEG